MPRLILHLITINASGPTTPDRLPGQPGATRSAKKQEKAERQAAKAPIDLRDVLNQKEQNKIEQLVQKKRARELANANTANSSLNLPPCNSRRLDEYDFLTNFCRRQRRGSMTLLLETRCVCK